MKAIFIKNIWVIVICAIVIVSLGNIDLLPWWSFLLPVMIVGYGLSFLKWNLNAFIVGFIAGFLVWFGGNLLFDVQYDGFIIAKLAELLHVPKILVLFLSGIIGGVITGLAMYVGQNILKSAELPNLE
jgi:hypothetical protein